MTGSGIARCLRSSLPFLPFIISRAAYLIAYWPFRYTVDGINYYMPIAENLASGVGFTADGSAPTAYVAPVYPIFLAAFLKLGVPFLITPAQMILDGLTLVLLRRMAAACGGQPAHGLLVTIAYGLYLPAARSCARIATETVFVFLLVLTLWLAARLLESPRAGRALVSGSLAGLTALCRPAMAAWIPLTILFAPMRRKPVAWALAVAGLAVVLAPWLARNAAVFGEPVPPLTTQAPVVMYRGAVGDGLFSADSTELARSDFASEIEKYHAYSGAVSELLRANPWHWLALAPVRLCRFWFHLPYPGSWTLKNKMRVAFHLAVICLAAVGIARTRGRTMTKTILHFVVYFSTVHALSFAVIRYSVPAITVLIVPAAVGLTWLFERRRPRRSEQPSR